MEWHELLESIQRFGLHEREAALYLALLRRGRATARELARETHLDRVLGYRMLDAMRARGIVEVTAERPRRYAAVPPRAFFERSLRERRVALTQDEALAHELTERLPELVAEAPANAPRFQVLTGTGVLYAYLREMMGRAREDIAVMVTWRSLRESVRFGTHSGLLQFMNAQGRFRLMVEADPRIQTLLKRFASVARKFHSAEVRQFYPQPIRLTIIDRSEALLFLVPEAHGRHVEQVGVWTDNAEFVAGQLLVFNTMWERAGPARPSKPPAARSRTPRPRKV
jgi:HTH-type transcriptional regulator, sugar sensing transcriptional regulator